MKRKNIVKRNSIALTIYAVLFLLICIFMDVMQFMTYNADDSVMDREPVSVTALVLLIYLAYKVQIVVRELGKMACGKVSGYDFIMLRIGKIYIFNESGRIKVKRFGPFRVGGQTVMAAHEYKDGMYPYLLYNVGGIVIHFVFYALVAVLLLICKDNEYVSVFLKAFSVMALILLLKEVVIAVRDLLKLLQNSETKRCLYNFGKINYLLSQGTRIKDMDEQLFKMPDSQYLNQGICSLMGVINVERFIDGHDFESAKKIGEYTLKYGTGLPVGNRNLLKLYLILCHLLCGDNQGEVEALIDNNVRKLLNANIFMPEGIIVQYAYRLFWEHNEKSADDALYNFGDSLNNCIFKCKMESLAQLMNYVRDRYDNKLSCEEVDW